MTTIATALANWASQSGYSVANLQRKRSSIEMFRKVTGSDANGTAIESDDPDDWGTTWSQVNTKKTELVNAEPMRLLREERNRRLAETDWWASSDLTMTAAQTTYRQALRDITDSATSLDDVTWPTKP